MITKYNNFLLDMLCESIVISTPEFRVILSRMEDNQIAERILRYINQKYDIITNYNAIGLSDTNDEISFLPDNQYQRIITSGENPWEKTKSKSKVGRMVRQILSDNGYNVNDTAIEKFVNEFKATWDKMHSTTRKLEVVTGEKILYWYDCAHYASTAGILGNSCMKKTEYNHFLQLYSSNPDKISLVILTENNELLARSVLWKLDSSSENKKLFLDRIYTRYDNDVKFLYDWVIENVVKGKEGILGSHRQGNGGNMIVNLEKTNFEAYPYADTFMYLYKKVIDGKIPNEGFISNRELRDKDKVNEYLLSSLQETNGTDNVRSHFYSDPLKVWIVKGDAAYIRSKGYYIYKKDAMHCKTRDEYYTEPEVIFSKRMDDWIPKSMAIEVPNLGMVLKDQIIKIIIEYTGKETNPVVIIDQLQKEGEDIKTEYFLKNEVNDKFFVPNDRPSSISSGGFDIKFRILDTNGSKQVNFLCYELFEIVGMQDGRSAVSDKILSMISQSYRRGSYYITKIDSDFYDIKINKNNSIYVYVDDYLYNFDTMFYRNYQDNKSKFKESVDHDKFIQELHDFKCKTNNDYRDTYEVEKLKNLGIKLDEVVIELSREAIESIDKQYLTDTIKQEFIESGHFSDISLDEWVRKLMVPFYSFYFLGQHSRGSRMIIKSILEEKYPNMNTSHIELISLITQNIIIDRIDTEINSGLNIALNIFKEKSGLTMSINTIKNLFSRKVSSENVRRIFIDSDLI